MHQKIFVIIDMLELLLKKGEIRVTALHVEKIHLSGSNEFDKLY